MLSSPYLPVQRADVRRTKLVSLCLPLNCLSLDSTSVKVHPDGTGAPKNGPQAIVKSHGGLNTKVHLIATSDRFALTFSLSGGNAQDEPEGRALLANWRAPP